MSLERISINLGVDHLLEMSRTAVNIAGDLATTTIVAKSEGEFDENLFAAANRPEQ